MTLPIDCILYVSFGGPEGPDDVIPFLENVLRGKPVPRERLLEVADHYQHFGGVSPINAQNRDIIARLEVALEAAGIQLPIVWGNRNWKPYLTDAFREMQRQGLQNALPIFTNMFSSYSGCRQYRENVAVALNEIGTSAPTIVPRLRFGFNHPKFIAAQTDLIQRALSSLNRQQQQDSKLLFTAHSIPNVMSDHCSYVAQLNEAAKLISRGLGDPTWELVYQSRSGPPQQPWLEPDIGDRIRELASSGTRAVVVAPIGFISDHIEVLFDLDTEASSICDECGIGYVRAAAVGTHPEFIAMLVDLIAERLSNSSPVVIGDLPPVHDTCPEDCCLYPRSGT